MTTLAAGQEWADGSRKKKEKRKSMAATQTSWSADLLSDPGGGESVFGLSSQLVLRRPVCGFVGVGL